MPPQLRGFLAAAMLVLSAANQAQAALLSLNFSGITGDGSIWADTTPMAGGTAFTIAAVINDQFSFKGAGYAYYSVTSLSADVGATHYSVLDAYIPNYFAALYDPTYQHGGGAFTASLVFAESDPFGSTQYSAFGASYSTVTPNLNVYAPTPTAFSGFRVVGNVPPRLRLVPSTDGWGVPDVVTITSNLTTNVNTRLGDSAALPVPAASWLFMSGLVALGAAAKKRSARMSA